MSDVAVNALGVIKGLWVTLGKHLRLRRLALALALALATSLGAVSPARAEIGRVQGWDLGKATQQIHRQGITMRYDPSLHDKAKSLMDKAPAWWTELEAQLGQDVPNGLLIHFVTHAGQVSAATGMPKWVSGVANGARGEIAISLHNPDGSRSDLASLLRHEMAHVALRRAVKGTRLPRWFHEGVADSLGANIDLGRAQTLAGAAFGVGILPLEAWDAALVSEGVAVSNTYASSRDLVKYLRFEGDEGQRFRRLIARLSQGQPFEAAIKQSYGQPLDDLYLAWKSSLRDRYFWYAMLGSGSLPMFLGAPLLAVAWRKKKRERAQALAAMDALEQQEHWMVARPH